MALQYIDFGSFQDFTWPPIDPTTENFNDGAVVGYGESWLIGVVNFDSAYVSVDPSGDFAF